MRFFSENSLQSDRNSTTEKSADYILPVTALPLFFLLPAFVPPRFAVVWVVVIAAQEVFVLVSAVGGVVLLIV